MKNKLQFLLAASICLLTSCGKDEADPPAPVNPRQVKTQSVFLEGKPWDGLEYNLGNRPVIRVKFTEPVNPATVANAVKLSSSDGSLPALTTTLEQKDSVLVVKPASNLGFLTRYNFTISGELKSASGGNFISSVNKLLVTRMDSTAKFPLIADDSLLTLVQKQTFKYFWDFGHPVSGMARERNSSGDVVTTGGTGFGIMAIVTGINRGFISRTDGLGRMQKLVGFLKNTAQRFHGAYPHWMNGITGAVVPFSTKDNGADLVETSFLVMGLLTSRQYFDGVDPAETVLRSDINAICNAVEWNWFRRNNENVLYWHWSPGYGWEMNLPVRGWNECLVTYVLAASSSSYGIPASVYQNGWANNGGAGFINGSNYYNINLPLGPAYGGPLFLSHYSFMGIDPNGLSDAYANYATQVKHHSLVNFSYCAANPKGYYGYSNTCWGLTASDIQGGYTASSPTNDVGVIAPTAAISSMPFTPEQSMNALKFFYYTMGDKLFKEYGFVDAFSLKDLWYANSFLAIDQGPIVVMLENYRSGLLWKLFTSCPEVKQGMKTLGFSAPYL
nr:glucoamylase family protein [Flavihumibacter rivuli]